MCACTKYGVEWNKDSKILNAATIYKISSQNFKVIQFYSFANNHRRICKNLYDLLENMASGKLKVNFPELIFLQMAWTQCISQLRYLLEYNKNHNYLWVLIEWLCLSFPHPTITLYILILF